MSTSWPRTRQRSFSQRNHLSFSVLAYTPDLGLNLPFLCLILRNSTTWTFCTDTRGFRPPLPTIDRFLACSVVYMVNQIHSTSDPLKCWKLYWPSLFTINRRGRVSQSTDPKSKTTKVLKYSKKKLSDWILF